MCTQMASPELLAARAHDLPDLPTIQIGHHHRESAPLVNRLAGRTRNDGMPTETVGADAPVGSTRSGTASLAVAKGGATHPSIEASRYILAAGTAHHLSNTDIPTAATPPKATTTDLVSEPR